MGGFTKGQKRHFLYAMLTTGSFHIIVLTNCPNFWARDVSWALLFPEASFPQLSISPWCLKRGTAAVSLRPFREDSSVRLICSTADAGLKLWCIRLSPARRWDTRALHGKGKQQHLYLSGCILCRPVFVCCSVPHPHLLIPGSYLSICLPCRWNIPKTAAVQSISIFQIY